MQTIDRLEAEAQTRRTYPLRQTAGTSLSSIDALRQVTREVVVEVLTEQVAQGIREVQVPALW